MSLPSQQPPQEEPGKVDTPGLESWLDVGSFTFWMRVAGWVLMPLLFATLQVETGAAILMIWLSISIIVHLTDGRALWLSLNPIVLILQVVYLGATAWVWSSQEIFNWLAWLVLMGLVFLLASDVFVQRRRAVILGIVMLGVMFESRYLMSRYPDTQVLELLWPAGGGAGAVAAIRGALSSRDSDGVMQTTLDYGRWRIEILSYGMKKALAIGIGSSRQ